MKNIHYKFVDGTNINIEASEEFYAEYEKLKNRDKLSNRRETRRHYSMDNLTEQGFQFKSKNTLPLDVLIQKEELEKILNILTDYQRRITVKYYIENKNQKEIAEEEEVSAMAISKLLKKIKEKIKNFVKGV